MIPQIAEIAHLPQAGPVHQSAPAPDKSEAMKALLAMLQAIALILSIRFFLFLSLVGGFVLALLAMSAQTTMSVVVLVSYCLLVLAPVVYLESKNKRG